MATVSTKMTALANEIREISGATNKLSIDAMTTHLNAANAEVTEQESIIADMNEVLDNLGAENVGGGSGGAVETCTMKFTSIAPIPSSGEVFFIDPSGTSQRVTFDYDVEYEIIKNSYIALIGVSIQITGNVNAQHIYGNYPYLFYVTGDAIFYIA